MEFKHYEDQDLKNCALELRKSFKEEPWNESWTVEAAAQRIAEIMSGRVSRGYVIYDGETVVSMLVGRLMTYLDDKDFYIDEFSVNPDYQRQGIGTKMLNYVREELRKEKDVISHLCLNTKRGYPSVEFYESQGFAIDDSSVFMTAKVK